MNDKPQAERCYCAGWTYALGMPPDYNLCDNCDHPKDAPCHQSDAMNDKQVTPLTKEREQWESEFAERAAHAYAKLPLNVMADAFAVCASMAYDAMRDLEARLAQ